MLRPDQARIQSFTVVPSLPEALKPLMKIAQNLWWCWQTEAMDLFARIDSALWTESGHNPVKMLGACSQSKLEALAQDGSYIAAMERVVDRLEHHLTRGTWFQRAHGDAADCTIAYFCAEFGLTECLRIYSGGLGILAGDHLKSASDLGLPLVAVGLLYRNGYFQQMINADGWQQEVYPEQDFPTQPIRKVRNSAGQWVTVSVQLPGREVKVGVWEAQVGRIRLFLLDANLLENSENDRRITAHLYGGDMEMRIQQEIVLGIGGMRALTSIGIKPTVIHLNEGHAAFSALERIRMFIESHKVNFDQARAAAASGHLFTTHTPVPAGIDRFPVDLIKTYFGHYHASLGLDLEGLLALGRENVYNKDEPFSMAVLALRTSDAANGVSKLHGQVSREMWGSIWPGVPTTEVPIGHVTNGVHARTWIGRHMKGLLDRYMGREWREETAEDHDWSMVQDIPDEELWRVRQDARDSLVRWIRRSLTETIERNGGSSRQITDAGSVFNPEAFTIGFARRFATYKRANLLFRDPQRLKRLIQSVDRPVQIVIAGKAHPADTQGKELIRQIVHFSREIGAHSIVFIENYNMEVARFLVQGSDIWLNTPRRGLEASGTSGMKAAMNGVLNCSILDGWWDEASQKDLGWAIGQREHYDDYEYQDYVESSALYDLLEMQVVPMFYDRDEAGVPRRWIRWMKRCMASLTGVYNTTRMVKEYTGKFYVPLHKRQAKLCDEGLATAIEFAGYRDHLRAQWRNVVVEDAVTEGARELGVGQTLMVKSHVHLGSISPEDVLVQAYYGTLDGDGRITNGRPVTLQHQGALGEGRHVYSGQLTPLDSGEHGFSVRVIPGCSHMASPFEPGLIAWDRRAGNPTLKVTHSSK